MEWGNIALKDFLDRTHGEVVGTIETDAKIRTYASRYAVETLESGRIVVKRADGHGDPVELPASIPLTPELVAFFGLYSGDGAKGSEDPNDRSKIRAALAFSQREPNLVRFSVERFRHFFGGRIGFVFTLGEDAAYFMAGPGAEMLARFYRGRFPNPEQLDVVRPQLNDADRQYLSETRNVAGTTREHLAFYYQHKDAMQEILAALKAEELAASGIKLTGADRVTASIRRPFKKGAREAGGSSRADEMYLGGVNGIAELFLKMLYELEASLVEDSDTSPEGLVRWTDKPSRVGELIELEHFFGKSPFGAIAGERPSFRRRGAELLGRWPRSREFELRPEVLIGPLFAYSSGLYLAEGGTPKGELFAMYARRPEHFSVAFTSSEDTSVSFIIRILSSLLMNRQDVVSAWKVKVGSQYFPELVSIGLKHGVPMLRGGESGDGKLRTMEISLAIKPWALQICPSLKAFEDRFSHVEPTGAGVARVDFWTIACAPTYPRS